MWNRNYLLSITEFLEGENSERLLEEAFYKVDSERRGKAERMKTDRGKAACLGAGLLLQLAVQEAGDWDRTGGQKAPETIRNQGALPLETIRNQGALPPQGKAEGNIQRQAAQREEYGLHRYSVSQLLETISCPIPLAYQYGKNGKPYFCEYPFYFNLSHSGDYAFCVLSLGEVGADIQQYRTSDSARLTERFFAPQEIAALRDCREGKDALFYQLWTRKEAYGKLTGEGIAGAVGINFLPGAERIVGGRKLAWEEYEKIPGYQLAVCRYDTQQDILLQEQEI